MSFMNEISDQPFVSVIILNYNGKYDIQECLDSVYNLDYENFEVIVIDNNSQDNSVHLIKSNYKNTNVIQLNKNFGFAEGNNKALPRIKGKYGVLLNMDTLVDKDWLTELVNTAEKSSKIGVAGSKIYYYSDKTIIDFAGGVIDKYGDSVHIGQYQRDMVHLNRQGESFFICGAALLFRTELVKKIGLFDPTYFAYYEDVDFCWRCWIYGYEVFFNPRSFIYHKISRTIKDNEVKIYLVERNKLRTILKNYELKTLIKVLPTFFRIRLNLIYINIGLKASILLIRLIKSIIWNVLHVFSMIKARIEIQKGRVRSDKNIFKIIDDIRTI